jgi:glycosyltransferase involved in cell wall biosynthesis
MERSDQTRTVAILHYAGPPTVGGVETTMAAHARVLAADGWRVRIVAGRAALEHPGVEVVCAPEFDSRGPEVEQVARELAAGVAGPQFEALAGRAEERLERALAGAQVAIVHNLLTLHKNLAFTAALHRLQAAGRAPRLLAWCHDFAWRDPLYAAELHAGPPWELLRQPWPGARYVAVSQDRREMLAELLGLPAGQIAVVTPGVDLAAFLKLEPETAALAAQLDLLDAEPLLLLPARITRRKNIEAAVAIAGALRAEGLRPRLLVTGPPGPHNPANAAYLAQLQALRAATGDEDSVVFLYERFTDAAGRPRPVSDAMLADLFRLADGLLMPSRYEGFGIPLLEAGLAGIPIFCSDIAPFRESAGEAALRFDPEAPAAETARRIAAALRNDARYAFRRHVRRSYTWEAIYQREIVPLLGVRG